MKTLERAEEARAVLQTDAFQLVAKADRSVIRALLDGDLSDRDRQRVEEEDARGLSRGATPRERDSIRTQLTFFRRMAETELPGERSTQLIAQLRALEMAVLGCSASENSRVVVATRTRSSPCDVPATPGAGR